VARTLRGDGGGHVSHQPRGFRFTPTCVGTASAINSPSAPSPVHPHVRGDGSAARSSSVIARGSPPRAWGRPLARHGRVDVLRFTPTCVGTAAETVARGNYLTVHPHVRGDGDFLELAVHAGLGSPPRAWGRHSTEMPRTCRPRFTPTCVGTARGKLVQHWQWSVHPHVRGDGTVAGLFPANGVGSPPRALGRQGRVQEGQWQGRFTPTCVGTAADRPAPPASTPVHPHVRGDGDDVGYLLGVGTASVSRMEFSQATVHPHVRGDGFLAGGAAAGRFGSPPRAWGRPQRALHDSPRPRFTPTCVGTATWLAPQLATPPVHPHVRGDGARPYHWTHDTTGSPPHAWWT